MPFEEEDYQARGSGHNILHKNSVNLGAVLIRDPAEILVRDLGMDVVLKFRT